MKTSIGYSVGLDNDPRFSFNGWFVGCQSARSSTAKRVVCVRASDEVTACCFVMFEAVTTQKSSSAKFETQSQRMPSPRSK